MSQSHRINRSSPQGLTLLEAMLMVVILGIIAVGFGISLQSSAHIPDWVDQRLVIHTLLVDKMEDLSSLDFATLSANTGLSDTVNVNGQNMARTVTVAAFDADGINGTDSDFIEVKVAIGSQYLKTRVAQP